MFGYIKIKYLTENIRKKTIERDERGIDNPDYNEAIMFVLDLIENKS